MRVAAIYDIHGNLPALEAVLRDVLAAGVDRIVVGGDVIPGPMPRESLSALFALDIPTAFIHGNGEREVLAMRAGVETGTVPERFRPAMRWTAEQLDDETVRLIDGWPSTTRLRLDSLGSVLFCHATPRNDTEIFTRLTPEERLSPIFDAVGATVVVCGHTHVQFDRMIGATRVVNAGSVGMPFQSAGAYWLLLGDGVQLRRTEYDLGEAAVRIRATAYPQAEEFAERYILHPPSEEETLAAFRGAELDGRGPAAVSSKH
jgi:predicted phosphodiesterase